ncbi:hypothetical protein JD969_16030 [Planctomycetota bacterium]|nr:hypothetical protein JD969_16030 [Planctomycetota bacterium]
MRLTLLLILTTLLTVGCSGQPKVVLHSQPGPTKTVVLSGSHPLRPEIKDILRDEGWTIQRFGRNEDHQGNIDEYPRFDHSKATPAYHFLDIASYVYEPSDNPLLSTYRVDIRMFGSDPNRDIFHIKGYATKILILDHFRHLINGRYME